MGPGMRTGIDAVEALRRGEGAPAEETLKQSRGLEQFLSLLGEQPCSAVLDFGGANQANINYITNLGHRLTTENLLYCWDSVCQDSSIPEPQKAHAFIEQSLHYPPGTFGGALAWDCLQFLPQPALSAVIEQLLVVLRPGAMLLAYFSAEDKSAEQRVYAYRIVDARTVLLSPKALRKRAQNFNNRALERLFERFQSTKFFLTRDHLREVLVRR